MHCVKPETITNKGNAPPREPGSSDERGHRPRVIRPTPHGDATPPTHYENGVRKTLGEWTFYATSPNSKQSPVLCHQTKLSSTTESTRFVFRSCAARTYSVDPDPNRKLHKHVINTKHSVLDNFIGVCVRHNDRKIHQLSTHLLFSDRVCEISFFVSLTLGVRSRAQSFDLLAIRLKFGFKCLRATSCANKQQRRQWRRALEVLISKQ